MLRILLIACLSVALLASGAFAQTSPPAPNPNEGAFDKLSPGNQKIAQALFDAQQSNATDPPSTTATPLSRDDIAAMKQDGKGWGGIFKEMQQEGLVQEKNLGQVVSRANHAARSGSNGTVITSGSGRSYVAGTKVKAAHGAVDNRTYGEGRGPRAVGGQGAKYGSAGRQSSISGGLQAGAGMGRANAGGHGGRGKH